MVSDAFLSEIPAGIDQMHEFPYNRSNTVRLMSPRPEGAADRAGEKEDPDYV